MRWFSFAFFWTGPKFTGELKFTPFYWRKLDWCAGNGLWLLTIGPFHFDHQVMEVLF